MITRIDTLVRHIDECAVPDDSHGDRLFYFVENGEAVFRPIDIRPLA